MTAAHRPTTPAATSRTRTRTRTRRSLAGAAVAGAAAIVLATGAPVAAAPPPDVTVDIGWECLPNGGNRFFWDFVVRNESPNPIDVQFVIGSYTSSISTIGGSGGALFGGGPYQPDGLPSTIDILVDGQVVETASVGVVDCLPDEAPEAQLILVCPDPVEEAGEDIAVVTVLRSKGTATTFMVQLADGTLDTVTVADAQEQFGNKVSEGDVVDAWVSADGGVTRLAELATTVDCTPDPTTPPTDPATTVPVTTVPVTTVPVTTGPGSTAPAPTTAAGPVPDVAPAGPSSASPGAASGGAAGADPGDATLPATGTSLALALAALTSTLGGAATIALARRRR